MKLNPVKVITSQPAIQNEIINTTRRKKDIIYGARSIKQRLGIFARGTQDYDILTKNPKKSANQMQKRFDKIVGCNYYYSKPAQHPGTYKVKSVGFDMKKGTSDDKEVIDYSQLKKPYPKYDVINGVRFRKLSEEAKAKRTALKDKTQAFRHPKDQEDLRRIKMYQSTFRY